jgi:hypothetical protein
MITSSEIRAHARKLWASGTPLRAWLEAQPLFPYAVAFRKPSAQEWLERFAQLRVAVEQLEAGSKATLGSGYSVSFKEVAHQKLGRLRVPERIVLESVEDAAACAGEEVALRRFAALAGVLRVREPRLLDWLAERPLRALDYAAELPRLLAVAGYFRDHPRPMRYARELGILGVDSKFIEVNRGVLRDWLDRLLPPAAIDVSVRGFDDYGFERRFGLRHEEPLIRFRWLDPARALAGRVLDASVPLSQFADYAPTCARVVVTENKVNFLTLPACPDALAIFGGGYAVERLGRIAWLAESALHYWGDIDTHGFAILNRLRGAWPHVRSLLMDRATLLQHRELWSQEPPERRSMQDLDGLDEAERALYDDLRQDRLGQGVRLEQERIDYARVQQALGPLGA